MITFVCPHACVCVTIALTKRVESLIQQLSTMDAIRATEAAAKDTAIAERNKLAERIKLLMTSNQELEEECDRWRQKADELDAQLSAQLRKSGDTTPFHDIFFSIIDPW